MYHHGCTVSIIYGVFWIENRTSSEYALVNEYNHNISRKYVNIRTFDNNNNLFCSD